MESLLNCNHTCKTKRIKKNSVRIQGWTGDLPNGLLYDDGCSLHLPARGRAGVQAQGLCAGLPANKEIQIKNSQRWLQVSSMNTISQVKNTEKH